MSASGPRSTVSPRGQTLPDFVVGIAIFLVTITFILQFVPQLILPYDAQEQPIVAQRVTNDLGDQLLASGETPSELNQSCTIAFFKQAGGANCPFDTDEAVTTQLGISRAYTVNLTLRTDPSDVTGSELLCSVNTSITTCQQDGDRLRIGPAVPMDDQSVAIGRRRVYIEDIEATLEVWIW